MVEALIGLLVGALLTGGTQTVLGWRDRVRASRGAARLLFADYVRAVAALRSLVDLNVWWSDELAPPLDAWREHRAALAGAMEGMAWQTIDGAFTQLADLEAMRRADRGVRGEEPLIADDDDTEGAVVSKAREALAAMESAGAELLLVGFTGRERRRIMREVGDDDSDGVALALAAHRPD
jgi:hypothetical protein